MVDVRNMGLYLGLHFETDCQSQRPAMLQEQEYCRLANSYMGWPIVLTEGFAPT